jgi:hypothetical protein
MPLPFANNLAALTLYRKRVNELRRYAFRQNLVANVWAIRAAACYGSAFKCRIGRPGAIACAPATIALASMP